MTPLFVVIIACLTGLVAWLIWLLKKPAGADPVVNLLHQQIEALRQQVSQSLSQNATLLQQQLSSVTQNLQSSSGDINKRLDSAAKLYGDLRNQLGQLSQSNAQIQSMVKDVSEHDFMTVLYLENAQGVYFPKVYTPW